MIRKGFLTAKAANGLVRDWFGQRDLKVLIFALAAVLAAWGFLELADEVREGETQDWDERILLALRHPADPSDPIGPIWVEEAVRDVTALGSTVVLALCALCVGGYLILHRQYHALFFLGASMTGAVLLNTGLKHYFGRPRPELVSHLLHVHTASFPSGHSLISAAVYVTLAALLTRLVKERRLKIYFLGVALLAAFLIGASRVYLGVHYPTDVLGGWSVGLSWAIFCWLAVRRLQKRGVVEPPR